MNNNFKKIIDFFKSENIELPEDVNNALSECINDLFNEENSISEDDVSVNIYFYDDKDDFEKDLTLINSVDVYIDGPSSGTCYDVYTYYGNVNISRSEKFKLCSQKSGEVLKDDLVDYTSEQEQSKIVDDNSYNIILLNKTEFANNTYIEKFELNIYCPRKATNTNE